MTGSTAGSTDGSTDGIAHPTRIATAADAAEIARLLHDFNTEFVTPTPGPAVLQDRLGRLLDGASVFAIVAGEPAVAVGLVTIRPNVWYVGWVGLLDELYVVPEFRNQGIGTAVLDHLDRYSREHRIDAIEINVDEGDVDAQRFYERHGYSSTEPDTGERAFYYFRELQRPS
ncbi:MAG: GNAT family N-acetyltransferase [Ilumatobacteraceae bacterium]